MVYLLRFVCVFLISFYSFCQSQELRGRVIADSLEGFAINIVNYTNKSGTTNNENGYFKISCDVNDSIIFSSVQYKVISYVVSEKDLENDEFRISLDLIVTKLDQVTVNSTSLSGNMNKDALGIKINPIVNNKTLGLPFLDRDPPEQIDRRIYTAKSGIIDRPINYLNGTLKKLKRVKAIKELDIIVGKGERIFDDSFFIEDLGVPKDLISDFVYYCANDEYFENLLENTKQLSLLEFFENKSILYKEYKQVD